MKKPVFLFIAIIIAVTALSCTAAKFLKYRSSPDAPPYSGRVELAGLKSPVTVVFDRHLVPNINASSYEDIAFTIGWLHARERLFQMEMLRRIASGRLSEMFGNGGKATVLPVDGLVGLDSFFRVIGLHRAGALAATRLRPESRAGAEAYAAGVNAYISTGTLPIELRLLDLKPAPWTVEDTLSIAKLNGYFLSSNMLPELVRMALRSELGPERQNELFPYFDLYGPYIVQSAGSVPPPKTPPTTGWETGAAGILEALASVHQALPFFAPPDASNNWAVSGAKTASGKPIFANDPHLDHGAPCVFYMVHLYAPGVDAIGVTMPGIPVIVLGRNKHLSWGLTTTFADTQDLYMEKVDPSDPSRYLAPGGSLPFEVLDEVIREKLDGGGFREHPLRIRITRHGPVINDAIGGMLPEGTGLLALRTPLMEPSDEGAISMGIVKAETVQEMRALLGGWGTPIQNWVGADDSGHILYFPAGLVPIRRNWDGTMPVPGWSGEYEWDGYIPPEKLPQMYDPPEGMIVTANNKVIARGAYPWPFSPDAMPGYRSARILELLSKKEKLTADDIRRIQLDRYSKQAEYLLPALLEALKTANLSGPESQAAQTLASWNREVTAGAAAPTIFWATYNEAFELAMKDKISDKLYGILANFKYMSGFFDRQWAENKGSFIFDSVSTPAFEGRDTILLSAFRRAVEKLGTKLGNDPAGWEWGKLHRIAFGHPFGQVKAVASTFNYGPFPIGGSSDTIWMSAWRSFNPEYDFTALHGPAFRQVADMADGDRATMVIDLGQSGWPATKGYTNAYGDWSTGALWDLPFGKVENPDGSAGTLTLVPAGMDRQK